MTFQFIIQNKNYDVICATRKEGRKGGVGGSAAEIMVPLAEASVSLLLKSDKDSLMCVELQACFPQLLT